jgi:GNAT superfamily N-acetyltransferase
LTPTEAAAFRAALEFGRLSEHHARMFASFNCHERIDDYLRKRALEDMLAKRSVTWVLVHEGSVLVAYITLSNHIVELGTEERQAHSLPQEGAEYPGVLIGQLGTDKGYQKRGLAKRLLKFAVGQATRWAAIAGCRVLIADVNMEEPALAMYRNAGFKPSSHIKYKDQPVKRGTQKQFLDLFSNPPPDLGPEGDLVG